MFQQALALHQAGRIDDAARTYRAVLQREKTHALALCNLGLIHLTRNEFDDALKLVRRAAYQQPKSPDVLAILGAVHQGLNQHEAAIAQFQKVLAARPEHADSTMRLAKSLQALNRHTEALTVLERAAASAPRNAQLCADLGVALRTLGRLDAALEALDRAMVLAPRQPGFHRVMGESKRYTADDPQLAAMEAMAAELASFTDAQQVDLHFALGKAYADVRQYERSFRHYLAGNAIKRREVPYAEAAVLGLLEHSRNLFTAEVIQERLGQGDPSTAPIFIVGMPRSGSTLIEQILASHPDVFGAGELLDFQTAVEGLGQTPDGPPPDIGPRELRQIGERYLALVKPRMPQQVRRFTDKMLGNTRFVGLIHLALPNAKIIYARRNPIDSCLSCFTTLFAVGQPYAYDLGELGRYVRAHEAIMQHWRAVLPPGVMIEVQYEDVVADLEANARRIVAHCGLEWTEACLEFYKTERPVNTASVVQVRQPIYRSSIGRWESYKAMLAPLLEALGDN